MRDSIALTPPKAYGVPRRLSVTFKNPRLQSRVQNTAAMVIPDHLKVSKTSMASKVAGGVKAALEEYTTVYLDALGAVPVYTSLKAVIKAITYSEKKLKLILKFRDATRKTLDLQVSVCTPAESTKAADDSFQVLTVSSKTTFTSLAGALSNRFRDKESSIIYVDAVGAQCVYTAIRAIALSTAHLNSGVDGSETCLVAIPSFVESTTQVADGEDKDDGKTLTFLRFVVFVSK